MILIILKAQELIERYRLKPRDALHISTAIASGETEVVSDDVELDVVGEIKEEASNITLQPPWLKGYRC